MPYVEAEWTTLYKFFSSDDELLYVGISVDPMRRSDQHKRDKPWWTEVSRSEMTHFRSKDAALEAESWLIKTNTPRYNVAGTEKQTNGAAKRVFSSPEEAAKRRKCILDIYDSGATPANQEQLRLMLAQMGHEASQPTVSRDLAALGLNKIYKARR